VTPPSLCAAVPRLATSRVAQCAGLAVAAAVTAGCLALAPPPETPPGRFVERAITVAVEGTPGLAFEGSYGTPSQTTPARGTVPAEYRFKTSVAVVVSLAKSAADGELVVRLLVNEQEVQRRATTAPFGSVVLMQRF
jgi:hypothetical protein